MAKKAELVEQAKKLKLAVGTKNTIAELEAAIAAAAVEVAVETKSESAAATATANEKAIAKAGKRSAKALEAAEAKVAKKERKADTALAETDEQPKTRRPVKPTRPRLERRGKKFREAAKRIEKGKVYSLAEAVELAAKTSPAKFDATVELHIRLNVDPKHADQNVRGTLVMPAGTGKTVRVAVFADEAVKAADVQGVETIAKLLDKQQFDFDILIATPANMAKLGKYARVLGPRGLMPNPKSGTVTTDIAKAVAEAKAGRVEYRVDSTGIVHVGIGKVSFGAAKLLQNAQALIDSLQANKPASVKSGYHKSAFVATTMGPSIAINLQ